MGRSRRPKPIPMEPYRVTAIRRRGPRGPQDGRWYWQCVHYSEGTKRTVWADWATRDEARQRTGAILARSNPEDSSPLTEVQTVVDLLECWVAWQRARLERRAISGETYRNYEYCARCVKWFTIPDDDTGVRGTPRDFGQRRLESLDGDDLEAYRAEREDQGSSPGTIALEMQVIRQAWKWGRDDGLTPNRALPRIEIDVEPTRSRHTPTPADVAAVIEVLTGWPRLAVWLMFATGARVGTVARLRWRQVDLEAGTVTFLKKRRTKVRKTRGIPIPRGLVEALREADPGDDDALVLGVKQRTATGGLRSRHLPRACAVAGVTPFSPHGLRRLASDELIRCGDLGTYAEIMGHSAKTALQHYRKATEADKRRTLQATRLGELTQGDRQVLEFPGAGRGSHGE